MLLCAFQEFFDFPGNWTCGLVVIRHHGDDVSGIHEDIQVCVDSGKTAAVADDSAERTVIEPESVAIELAGMVFPHNME